MNTTSNLSELISSFYDRVFLKRTKELIVMDQFGQNRPLPAGEGKTITFSRYLNLATPTTSLTEGTNPSGSNLSAENVTAQIAQEGDFVKISKLVSLTAIDKGITERIPILSQQAAERYEVIVRDEVAANGTEQIVSTAANMAAIAATDVLASKDIRIAVRNLRDAKGIPFAGGFFAGVCSPFTKYDFQSDTTWVAAKQYSEVTDLYKGEIGKWFGVRFVETTIPYRQDVDGTKNISSGAVYTTLVMGMEGYGITQLDGLKQKIYVYSTGNTENPLDMYSTAGWKYSLVSKILRATWVRCIRTGATA